MEFNSVFVLMSASTNVSSIVELIVVMLVLGMVYVIGQFFFEKKNKRLQFERRGISFEDFIRAELLQGVPKTVSDAVFRELLDLSGFPPLAEDRLYEEYGLAGSDIDDLILHLSERLEITWDHSSQIEAPISNVADLAHFLNKTLRLDPR